MNLDRLNDRIRRFSFFLLGACGLLALCLGFATFTDMLALPHTGQEIVNLGRTETAWRPAGRTDSRMVAETIRGKAVFRTLRLMTRPVVDDSGRYRLTGTSERDGVLRAYVKDTKLKKIVTLYEGDVLGGRYEIVAIHKDSVELKRGGEVTALRK